MQLVSSVMLCPHWIYWIYTLGNNFSSKPTRFDHRKFDMNSISTVQIIILYTTTSYIRVSKFKTDMIYLNAI